MKVFYTNYDNRNSSTIADNKYGESKTDRSNYRPDPVAARDKLISMSLGSAGVPVYDFADGKIPDIVDSKYWNYILALKRKDLDVTELEQIRSTLELEVKTNVDKDKFEALLKEANEKKQEIETSEKSTENNSSSE